MRDIQTRPFIRRLSNFIRYTLITVISVYATVILLLNIPYIQQKASVCVSQELGKALQTNVHIGQINIGLLNRIILDDVQIDDQEGKPLFQSERLSAKFNVQSLLQGRIMIHNIQLYRFGVHLHQQDSLSAPNYQFIIDALASQDSSQSSAPDLRINTLLIRHGLVEYHCDDVPKTPHIFNPGHIRLEELRANISLKALMSDSIHTTIRHLSFREHSGFELSELAFKLTGNTQRMTLSRFALRLPASEVKIDTLQVGYEYPAADFLKTLRFSGGIEESYFTPQDISAFVPSLVHFKNRILLNAHLQGNNREVTLSPFYLHTENNDIQLLLHARIRNPWNPAYRFFDCRLTKADVSSTGLRFLSHNLDFVIPPALIRMGYLSFKGEASGLTKNLLTKGSFTCGLGTIESSLTLGIHDDQTSFKGTLSTEDFQTGTLLGNPDFGLTSLQLEINGTTNTGQPFPDIHLTGVLPTFEYKQYTYRGIRFQSHSLNGGYDGSLHIDDPNLRLLINGRFNTKLKLPEYNLTVKADHFRPHALHLSDKYEDTEFAVKVRTDFKGNTMDNLMGLIRVDSLQMKAPERSYFMENLTVASYPTDKDRQLSIRSDFMKGHAYGQFRFETLPGSIQGLVHDYLPSLIPATAASSKAFRAKTGNQIQFDLTVSNTDLLSEILYIPLRLRMPVTLKGFFHEPGRQINIEGYLPGFEYKGKRYESGMILLQNPGEALQATVRISKQTGKQDDYTNATLQLRAQNDRLQTTLHWGNNAAVTYSGTFASTTQFLKHNLAENKLPTAHMSIHPSDIIINDTVWNLRPSSIVLDSGRVYVNNFNFQHGTQHLRVNGRLTDKAQDSLFIDLNQIRLEYIFDILDFHPVDFRGRATGKAIIRNALTNPSLSAQLNIGNFTFNSGLMGDMYITGQWNEEEGNILLDADIREGHRSRTQVKGWVSPKQNALDLHITTDSTTLEFLNEYTAEIFKQVKGRVSGPVHLFGPFSKLNLEGDVSGRAAIEVDVLNTAYRLQFDSVNIRPNLFSFNKVAFYDRENHAGDIRGSLRHDHLENWSYDFTFRPQDMLLYDDPDNSETAIYGSIYGNGTIKFYGGGNQMNVNANLRTAPQTVFVYNLGKQEVTSNEFITFIDKTPRPAWKKDIPSQPETETLKEESTTDIHINTQLEVTPDAHIKVIMDPVSGDYATARGSGNFQANYFNKGDFKLYGTYTLDHGLYKLSLQDVIHKDFQLRQGGTITFSGKPEESDMNLQAIYTVNSASLNDLSPNAGFTQNSVRVNCLLNLTGRISNPNIDFDLELPNVNEEEESLVRSFISTDEQMEMQIIYLLGIGRFYTYDYATANAQDETGQSSAMNSLLSSTLSGQLNDMLSQVVNSNQWNFGTNLSTGSKGWTNMEVEGMLSGRLLNNRLLINGNFGYRENQLSNTNFIGDFDVQWLLTPSGDISLKGYNQTNDRYFTKTTLTTQGIGILFKREFDTWRELFSRRVKAAQSQAAADSLSNSRSAVPHKKEKKKRKFWFWEFD